MAERQFALIELRNSVAFASDAAALCGESAIETLLVAIELLVVRRIVECEPTKSRTFENAGD
jgi:hypothetical protein